MQAKGTMRNTGSPSGDRRMDQLAARERKAGLIGMTERLVVPTKPGNSGGGASVEGGRTKRRRMGRLAIRLITPQLFPEVADGVTCNRSSDCVSLLREPDAVNPHVRFDERDVETEAWRG